VNRSRRIPGSKWTAAIAATTCVVLLAACGGDDGSSDATTAVTEAATSPAPETTAAVADTTAAVADTTAAPASDMTLLEACGDKVVLQTNWYPEGEHGAAYQLAGPGGNFDASNGVYSNEIGDTGVTFEVRAGGPFLGGQRVDAIMYQDDDILLGMEDTTTIMTGWAQTPTVSVFAPYEKPLDVLLFDPATYDFSSIDDFAGTDIPILAYSTSEATAQVLIDNGLINPDQVDYSYDGSLSRFVVADGKTAQFAYATNEPYRLEHETAEWMKPVKYFPLADKGFEIYSATYAVTPDNLVAKADCLSMIVPMLQQSLIDYLADPAATNAEILEIVDQLGSAWTMTQGHLDNTAQVIAEGDFVSNGDDETIGNFDMDRVQRVVDDFTRIYGDQGIDVAPGITADMIATNQFIDPEIGR
jgi:hypothetical protein